jgi:hypothetical protein
MVSIQTSRSPAFPREDDLLRRSFVLMLKAEGKSPMTVRRYELSLRQYQAFAGEMGFPRQVKREHVATPASRISTRVFNVFSGTSRLKRLALSLWITCSCGRIWLCSRVNRYSRMAQWISC